MKHTMPSFLDNKDYIAIREQLASWMHSQICEITDVSPPQSSKITAYEEALNELSSSKGSAPTYPYLSSGLGNGAFVKLNDGSVKIDFISGIGAHWAHGNIPLINASIDGAVQDTVMQGNLQQHIHSVKVYSQLARMSGMDHSFISSSGAMAAENALKIAFHHFEGKRPRILAFKKCFMGRTLALATITDNSVYKVGLPKSVDVDYLPFYDANSPEESIANTCEVLRSTLKRYPGQHAALCMEVIQGEGGYFPGSEAFFKAIFLELKKHGVLIIADEIQSFGRTEKAFAYQSFNLQDEIDIVTVGKLTQICATMYRKELHPKPGIISQTFTSSSTAIHAASHILNIFETGDLLGKNGQIMTHSRYMMDGLKALAEEFPHAISGPYGYGLMIAFTPYSGEKDIVMNFAKQLFNNGLICFLAGRDPYRLRFLMPVGALSRTTIEKALTIIKESIRENDSAR